MSHLELALVLITVMSIIGNIVLFSIYRSNQNESWAELNKLREIAREDAKDMGRFALEVTGLLKEVAASVEKSSEMKQSLFQNLEKRWDRLEDSILHLLQRAQIPPGTPGGVNVNFDHTRVDRDLNVDQRKDDL